MTKKLVCLLLAAFLFVSLIALLAACRSGGNTQESTSQSTVLSPQAYDGTTPDASSPDTADVFSLEVPTEETEE